MFLWLCWWQHNWGEISGITQCSTEEPEVWPEKSINLYGFRLLVAPRKILHPPGCLGGIARETTGKRFSRAGYLKWEVRGGIWSLLSSSGLRMNFSHEGDLCKLSGVVMSGTNKINPILKKKKRKKHNCIYHLWNVHMETVKMWHSEWKNTSLLEEQVCWSGTGWLERSEKNCRCLKNWRLLKEELT